jgi:hypothetical protein
MLSARESSGAGRAYRALMVALRLASVGLLLLMLAQWALALRLTGPPAIALVIDHSASMSIADRYSDAELPARLREALAANGLTEPTRLNLAKLLVVENEGRLLRELSDRYRLSVYVVAAEVKRLSSSLDAAELQRAVRELSAEGELSRSTRLGDAVGRVLDDSRAAPPAALVLLSDGVTTEGLPLADAAQRARAGGLPILAVGIGSGEPPRDIEVADVLVDDAVFVNDLVSVQAQIKASGFEGQSAQVTLRREGDETILAREDIALPAAGQTLSVRLVDRPTQAGQLPYVVEVAPRDEETDPQNNRQRRIVSVHDEAIRVLLVQGYPSYEFRYLKTLLERDPTIRLSTYLQDADPEYAEQDKTALRGLPIGRDELFEYDVLLIGDVDPRIVPRSVWQNVRAFVSEKGGGVAFLAGPRYLPWLYRDNQEVGALLPIEMEGIAVEPGSAVSAEVSRGFTVKPTPLGLQNPALQLGDTAAETEQIWRSLAPQYWLYESSGLKAGAQVLAQSAILNPQSAIPLICFQYVGAGRVLFHAVDSTWRWRIGGGEAYFARYWVQTIRYLARGKLAAGRGVQLTTDRREYRSGEEIHVRARFLDARLAPAGEEVVLLMDSPGQARRRVALERNQAAGPVFEITLSELPPGQYEIVLAEPQLQGNPPSRPFTVAASAGEWARLEMDAAAMSGAAAVTRGKFYTVADAQRLLSDLPAGRRVPIENLPPISIWNRWWLLATFLGCITTEWILRKRKGML